MSSSFLSSSSVNIKNFFDKCGYFFLASELNSEWVTIWECIYFYMHSHMRIKKYIRLLWISLFSTVLWTTWKVIPSPSQCLIPIYAKYFGVLLGTLVIEKLPASLGLSISNDKFSKHTGMWRLLGAINMKYYWSYNLI